MKKRLGYGLLALAAVLTWFAFLLLFPQTEGQRITQGTYPSDVIPLMDAGKDFQVFRVKAGNHRFLPMRSLCPRGFQYSFTGSVVFDSAAYVFPAEYKRPDESGIDFDYFDWNKLFGLTGYLSRPNKNAAMIAWRWDVDSAYCFQLAAYTNDRRGDWRVSDPVTICAGQEAQFSMFEYKGEALYSIYANGTLRTRHPWKRPFVSAEIDTWMGGQNNAPGPFGGVAHRDLEIRIDASSR